MKAYAYITAECCKRVEAVLPGSEVGGRPVSKHGDYTAWCYNKRETLAVVDGRGYIGACARAVAKLRGW